MGCRPSFQAPRRRSYATYANDFNKWHGVRRFSSHASRPWCGLFEPAENTKMQRKLCADETFTTGSSAGSPIFGAGTSSAQYLVDHIFVYRPDQNLPYKCSDV